MKPTNRSSDGYLRRPRRAITERRRPSQHLQRAAGEFHALPAFLLPVLRAAAALPIPHVRRGEGAGSR